MSQKTLSTRVGALSLGLLIATTTMTACTTDGPRRTDSTPSTKTPTSAPAEQEHRRDLPTPSPTQLGGNHHSTDSSSPSVSRKEPSVKRSESKKAIDRQRVQYPAGHSARPSARQALQHAPLENFASTQLPVTPAPQLPPIAHEYHAQQIENERDRENYAKRISNPVQIVADNPISTFSIDVDTGAYANVRRFLNNDRLPPQDAVRVEELINYFTYDYPTPDSLDQPFSVTTEVATTPWNPDSLLMHIGLKGYDLPANDRPSTNLVFLLDVSGSMSQHNKLPLLKKSFRLLTKQLNAQDSVAIVVYAGASGVVLEPTPGDQTNRIMRAMRELRAGGSTNGAAGINLAYELAEEAFIEDGINRIVLATDGDFNVGTTNFERLIDLVERKRESGIALTTLGFGGGNYNDHLMEQLADAGNGNYAYIDTLAEARKVLVNEISSTLVTIAKDVKLQIEFNPQTVAEYRLIGYENRMLRTQDFNDDTKDAGEIGAGHTVTALYEIIPTGNVKRWTQSLRYQEQSPRKSARAKSSELAFLKLRFKQPNGDKSRQISYPIEPSANTVASDNLAFSAAVAAFGQLLAGDSMIGNYTYEDILSLAKTSQKEDLHGYRREFMQLVEMADELSESSSNSLAISD